MITHTAEILTTTPRQCYVGCLDRGHYDVIVGVFDGKPTLDVWMQAGQSAEVDPEDARLIASWLLTAARLTEGPTGPVD